MAQSDLERLVKLRAGNRCEYCQMHQGLQGATFHVEHVIPQSRGGRTELANLAWACPGCNLHKSNRTELLNPDDGSAVEIFNPRIHLWTEHFGWEDYHLIGLTTIGRALISAFQLNHERRIRIRQAEQMFGMFPPET